MSDRAVADLLRAAHEVGRKRLTWGPSGNVSLRLDGHEFLISASGAALETLREEQVVRCGLDGSVSIPSTRPSLEMPMHRAIYTARDDVRFVLHASPFYTTLVASSHLEVDADLTVDSVYYLRSVGRISFNPPGTDELAEAVARAAGSQDVLLVDNHGALALGATAAAALHRLECLEMLCRMVTYGALGVPLRFLGRTQVDELLVSLKSTGTP